MSSASDARRAQALAIRARGCSLPADFRPSPDILDSWHRCLDLGLDAHGRVPLHVVEAADLAQRQEQSEFVRRLARAELETLSQQIAGSNFLLAFADSDGVILDLYADNRFTMSGDDAGIVQGSCWSESLCGTNGLGTALASGRPVAVTGLEHYFLSLGEVSCTAAPVHDAFGRTVGVLDASSYFQSRQQHTQALVQMAATHIENGLLQHQMRLHLVLALHPRPEFLGTLSAGLLAFDGDGRLLSINARARQLLQGLDAAPGATFEPLFGEPFERFLGRLSQSSEQRLRDRLGSAWVVRSLSHPRDGQRTRLASRPVAALPQGRDKVQPPRPASDAVTEDPAVAEAFATVRSAVRLAVPLLIQGETGTGKELLARHAHDSSGRPGAFIAVNCAALPAELFEAELFGYAAGAFTGAQRQGSPGLIVSADRGSLLLDEVGELPLKMQAALLRFMDDSLVRPVGGQKSRAVDVQLLAATHVDLNDAVATKRFRADLLYRLNIVRVELPPLRQRRDFAAATRSLLAAIDRSARIDDDAIARLATHGWPGNFRELRAVLTRALLASPGSVLTVDDVAPLLPAPSPTRESLLAQNATELIRRELARQGGNVSRTAQALGVSRTTVYRHVRPAA